MTFVYVRQCKCDIYWCYQRTIIIWGKYGGFHRSIFDIRDQNDVLIIEIIALSLAMAYVYVRMTKKNLKIKSFIVIEIKLQATN